MRKIFIIEDEQDIIQAVHDELKKWGYDVTGVSDWDNMMAEVKEADPVLILMDITLPMFLLDAADQVLFTGADYFYFGRRF